MGGGNGKTNANENPLPEQKAMKAITREAATVCFAPLLSIENGVQRTQL